MGQIFGVAGAVLGAAGNIAAGNMAAEGGQVMQQAYLNEGQLDEDEGQFEATQLRQNANTAIASSQRTAMDTRLQASLLGSKFTAQVAGSGLTATGATPMEQRAQIAGRGEYLALGELAGGENTAASLKNEAEGAIFSGEVQNYGAEVSGEAAEWSGQMTQMADDTKAVGQLFQAGSSFFSPGTGGQSSPYQTIASYGTSFMNSFGTVG